MRTRHTSCVSAHLVMAANLFLAGAFALTTSLPTRAQGGSGGGEPTTILSCGGQLSGDCVGAETGCGDTAEEAGIDAVSKHIAGGVNLACEGCDDEMTGCEPWIGGFNVQITYWTKPNGDIACTITSNPGASTVDFNCHDCD